MYKRLYEEEHKSRSSSGELPKGLPGKLPLLLLLL
jgi:hypothetical protein